ncbi:type II toxin-antitoxin system PemK/MazF family toxin [Corynebacterium tapiri]|uniref:Type II toxin-antitoxin system PemK/MazF family toxin n=2 Tax=Corynebacterium tapiri TaxID=1448266 RepID=A0A5C4U475_9CORY|nr:type II toxin-antitoxin system PemK/MazF family toxin [Corynebacterium tapiri]
MFFRSLRPKRRPAQPEDGLRTLRGRLGLAECEDTPAAHHPPAPLRVHETTNCARTIVYAPDIDGHAEAGEVVWLWAPVNGPSKPPSERPMLVVGRTRFQQLLGLLISADPQHDEDPTWMGIGTGLWETSGTPCWMRMDKVIEVPEYAVRREGALFPERRFERIAHTLRTRFGWV